MDKLTKGDIVGIWQKPITQEGFEGKAELVEFIRKVPGAERSEEWYVHFESDDPDETYGRIVTY